MSGAVATGSLVKFLRSPSLASTGWLAAGVAGAGLYYGAGETTKRGFEDGPWAAVGMFFSNFQMTGTELLKG